MALYYQIFYILVVFVPFLHTSRTFVLPVHAVQDSAQVLEERVKHELKHHYASMCGKEFHWLLSLVPGNNL